MNLNCPMVNMLIRYFYLIIQDFKPITDKHLKNLLSGPGTFPQPIYTMLHE